MVRSGSPIQSTASGAIMKASKPNLSRKSTTSSGQIRDLGRSRLSSMTSSSPTALPFRLTRRSSMSSTPASLTDRTTHRISVCSMRMLGPERCRTAKSLPKCQSPALPTGYALTPPGVSGVPWAGAIRARTACAATLQRANCSARFHIPETVANLCFGGQQRNRLYICGSSSLYAVYTSVQGALKP